MDDLVITIHGELPRSSLIYADEVAEDVTAVYTTRTWFFGDEAVRRDSWVDFKRGHSSEAQKGN